MRKYPYPKLRFPHCRHCSNYHEYTGSCLAKLVSGGLSRSAKASGSRNCKNFKVLDKYKNLYSEELVK